MTDATYEGRRGLEDIRSSYMALTARRRLYSMMLLGVFLLLFAGGFHVANDRNSGGFLTNFHQILDFPRGIVEQAWAERALMGSHLLEFLPSLVETLNIAAAATLLGGALGALLSLLSTRGLARWPRLIPLFRRVMDVMRAVPEIVIALVLIFVLGSGPVPAVIAIAFHTGGALGKLFSEVNENASLKPVEGLASVGATWSQRMLLGVMPQVVPNWTSYLLLRFEINIRASAILGFVGGGGIGYDLRNNVTMGGGRFDEAAAIFILLFLTIVAVDQVSSRIRDRLIHGGRA